MKVYLKVYAFLANFFLNQSPVLAKDKILYIDFKLIIAEMLQPLHRQRYQEFKQALQALQTAAATPDLHQNALRDQLQDVRQLFHQEIAGLSADDLVPEQASRWQSWQTEIYKQMLLLETDVMLFQASRSSTTSVSRSSKVRDRIHTLIQYCDALLQL